MAGPSFAVQQIQTALKSFDAAKRAMEMPKFPSIGSELLQQNFLAAQQAQERLVSRISSLGTVQADALRRISDLSLGDYFRSLNIKGIELAAQLRTLTECVSTGPGTERLATCVADQWSAQPDEQPQMAEASVLDVTAERYWEAWLASGKPISPAQLVNLILTVLLFIAGIYINSANQAELQGDIGGQIEQLKAQTTQQLAQLIRELQPRVVVQRTTKLWQARSTRSRVIRYLSVDDRIMLLERRRKWTRIVVLSDDGQVLEEGWTLNKYLKRR
jgi:hypothetical protein